MEKYRDLSIDFTRGVAIFFVIFAHNLPTYEICGSLWTNQAVPLLLLITANFTYRGFEKGKTLNEYYSKKSIKRKFNKIFAPFLVVTFIQGTIFFLFDPNFSLKDTIGAGGIGPGSYFPWCYLQYWLYLPFIIWLINSFPLKNSFLIILTICICYEIICCLTEIPLYQYRLLSFRYLVVLYLGCIVKKLDLSINRTIIILALIGSTFLLLRMYGGFNTEPILLNTWKAHQWPSAFYSLLLFLFFSKIVYKKFIKSKITKFITQIGTYSYEIFVCQMVIFSFIHLSTFIFVNNTYIQNSIYFIITTFLSIAPILVYKTYLKKIKIYSSN